MKTLSYSLITPLKNEEDHLRKLAHCVVNQSHLPDVWVIIDDGSTDRTPEIIEELTTAHTWIHAIRLEEDKERTFDSHFAEVVRAGFDRSVELASDVDCLIKVDADVRFHENTFEILCETMDNEADLAIASPRLMTVREEIDVTELKWPERILRNSNLTIRTDKKRTNEPTDGIRIYRKRFLDEIGGFPITDASADIVLGKAVIRGYSISFVDGLWGYLVRETGTTLKSDYVRGKIRGYRLYIAHYHPVLVIAKFVWDVFFNRTWVVGEVVGYLESLVRRKPRINDPDVVPYFRKERFKTVLTFIKRRFQG